MEERAINNMVEKAAVHSSQVVGRLATFGWLQVRCKPETIIVTFFIIYKTVSDRVLYVRAVLFGRENNGNFVNSTLPAR